MESRRFGQLKEDLFGLLENERIALEEIVHKLTILKKQNNSKEINPILSEIEILEEESEKMEEYIEILHNKGITDVLLA